MRVAVVGWMILGLAGAAHAQAPSPTLPTPATPGPNPGAAATDAITNPIRPPADIAPPQPGAGSSRTPGDTSPGTSAPMSPPAVVAPAPPASPTATGPMSPAEMRGMLEAARQTAKSTQEAVEYGRVVPDILTQILAKLDKLENKLDKIENAVKAGNARGRR